MRRRKQNERGTSGGEQMIPSLSQGETRMLMRGVWEDISAIGSLPCQALFFTLLLSVSPRLAWAWLIAFILAHILIILIRLAYFKPRPRRQAWKSLIGRIDASSFPSMHATRMGIAVMISWFAQYGWLILIMSGIALLVMTSRIILKKHDITDISVGFLLGSGIVWLIWQVLSGGV